MYVGNKEQAGRRVTLEKTRKRINTERTEDGAQRAQRRERLEAAEEFVEFVGGVEVGFEFAGVEALAEVVEAAREEVECGGEDFAIGEDNVAPGGVGAAGETERIAQAGAGDGDGQAVFVEMIVEERAESYGGELGEMRDHADGVVVLLRAEPERAGADFFEELEEGVNAGIALRWRCGRLTRVGGVGDQRVGRVAKEVGVGLRDAGDFAASHGVTAEEERGGGRGKIFGGGLRDAQLGAAGVGDQGVLGSEAGDFREKVDGDADGERDVNQVGAAERGGEIAGEGFVEDIARAGFADDFGAVPAGDVQVGGVFAEGQGKGAANQASAEDGGASD